MKRNPTPMLSSKPYSNQPFSKEQQTKQTTCKSTWTLHNCHVSTYLSLMNSSQYLGELPIGIVAAIYVHHIQSPVEAPSSTGAGSLSSNSYLSYSSTTTNNKQQTTTSTTTSPHSPVFFFGEGSPSARWPLSRASAPLEIRPPFPGAQNDQKHVEMPGEWRVHETNPPVWSHGKIW